MIIKYTSIFHSKALQNLPKLRFLVWKQTIWQPSGSVTTNVAPFICICARTYVCSQRHGSRVSTGSHDHGTLQLFLVRCGIPMGFGWVLFQMTRWFSKNIAHCPPKLAQNVAQSIISQIRFTTLSVKKLSPIIWISYVFFKILPM
jgi:hypothetical protein